MIALDPLGGHSDPRLYVALDSDESVLAAVAMGLKAGSSPVLLSGPAGIGKTLLLRVLAEREWKSFPRTRFSPRLPPEPDEVAGYLLHLLFGKLSRVGPAEAEVALLEELRLPGDRRTLLLVDDVQHATEASIRKLVELSRASTPALAVVAAGTSGGELHALVETLAPGLTVSLPESLPDAEIGALYEAIFMHPGLSARLRHRLASASRDQIRCAAAGSPRLLKNELARLNLYRPAPVRQLPAEELLEAEAETVAGIVARSAAETGGLQAPEQAPRLRLVPAAPQEYPPPWEVREADPYAASPVTGFGRWAVPLLALLILGSAPSGAAAAAQRVWTLLLRWAIDALSHVAPRLGEALAALESAARAAGSEVAGPAVTESLGDARDRLLASAHASTARMSRALLRSATDAVSDATWRLGEVAMAAECAARVAVESGHEKVTHVRTATSPLLRRAAEEVARSASRLVESVALLRAFGAAAREAGSEALGMAPWSLRSGTESLRGAKDRLLAGTGSRFAQDAADRSRTALAGSHAYAMRARTQIRRTARHATRSSAAVLTRVGRAARRIAPKAALPATALLALTLLPLGQHAAQAPERARPVVAAREPVARVTPSEAIAPSPAPAPAPSVDVQVNARPWARVRINGVDAGATPLRQRLAPGTYQLEASFPDGRTIQREIDVDGERRFVSLP
ncbi:MAG TPA: AAA family ATPase [Myxococcota bacterium]|nr:AAA family ATPase [Myxococcota bacterium]